MIIKPIPALANSLISLPNILSRPPVTLAATPNIPILPPAPAVAVPKSWSALLPTWLAPLARSIWLVMNDCATWNPSPPLMKALVAPLKALINPPTLTPAKRPNESFNICVVCSLANACSNSDLASINALFCSLSVTLAIWLRNEYKSFSNALADIPFSLKFLLSSSISFEIDALSLLKLSLMLDRLLVASKIFSFSSLGVRFLYTSPNPRSISSTAFLTAADDFLNASISLSKSSWFLSATIFYL